MKVWYTLKFQFRNPLVIPIHITTWILSFFLFDVVTGSKINNAFQSILDEILVFVVLGFISSYRETRGKLTGIATTQQNWRNWSDNQEQHLSNSRNIEIPILSEYPRLTSFLTTVKNTVVEMFRNPLLYVFHFICWNFVFIFGTLLDDGMQYTIREEWPMEVFQIIDYVVSDMKHEFFYGLIVILIFAFITSTQEAKGKVQGKAKEQQQWSKWYEQQNSTVASGQTIEDSPSLITNETGQLFVIRMPVYTIIHVFVVVVLCLILAVQLILITDWSGIKFLGWIVLLVLLIH
ncbi:MAG: hypothetical protein OXI67_07945 [Candidatus Poribacteria bacterium]|nr:hypothetical protein [Candidatus Poribacteria bacterium]